MTSLLMLEQEARQLPKGTQEAWAQFNAISGAFTGIHGRTGDDLSALDTIRFKYVPIEIDMTTQHVVGNFNSFQIVNTAEEPEDIHEAALDGQMREKIAESYSNNDRIDIIEAALLKLAQALHVELPELEEVVALVAEVKRTNELRKVSLASDPEYNYISNSQQMEIEMAQMEGGLHEIAGPRRIAYGVTTP